MLPDVFKTLSTTEMLALVGNPPRIFGFDTAPQGVKVPYLTWFVVLDDPHVNLSSVPKSDVGVVQIDCYAGPGGSAESLVERLATAARDALDAAGIVNRISFSTREPDTELFRISLQADFIRNR